MGGGQLQATSLAEVGSVALAGGDGRCHEADVADRALRLFNVGLSAIATCGLSHSIGRQRAAPVVQPLERSNGGFFIRRTRTTNPMPPSIMG